MATFSYGPGEMGPTSGLLWAGKAPIRWPAIFAGTVVIVGIQWMITLLGLAIGLAALDSLTNLHLGPGSGLWLLFSTLVSVYIGSWVAGRMSGVMKASDGAIHGIITWALFIMLTVWMMGSGMGAILGGAYGLVQSATTGVAQSTTATQIQRQVQGSGAQAHQIIQENQNALNRAQNVATHISWWIFVTSLLSFMIAGWGGRQGTLSRPELREITLKQL